MAAVLVLLACIGGVRAAPDTSDTPATANLVLVLGDSLSAAHNIPVESGWVYLLQERLQKMETGWTVINASVSGETSLSGRNRLPDLLQQYHPGVVVIELGANDGLQGLPLDKLQENLAAMIDAAQATNAKVLLLGIELPVNYGPQYRDGLRRIYSNVSALHRAALVPFLLQGLLDGDQLKPEWVQEDGLHPVAEAEPRVLDTVWRQLQPLLSLPPSPLRSLRRSF